MSESCVTYHCPDCIFTSTNEDGTGYYEIICDVCINRTRNTQKPNKKLIESKLLDLLKLKEHTSLSLSEALAPLPDSAIIDALKNLLATQKIQITSSNTYKLNE